jgi:hypothetical protein
MLVEIHEFSVDHTITDKSENCFDSAISSVLKETQSLSLMSLAFFPVFLKVFDGSSLSFSKEIIPIISSNNPHANLQKMRQIILLIENLCFIKEFLDIHGSTKEIMDSHRVDCIETAGLFLFGESDFTSLFKHFLDLVGSRRSTSDGG